MSKNCNRHNYGGQMCLCPQLSTLLTYKYGYLDKAYVFYFNINQHQPYLPHKVHFGTMSSSQHKPKKKHFYDLYYFKIMIKHFGFLNRIDIQCNSTKLQKTDYEALKSPKKLFKAYIT